METVYTKNIIEFVTVALECCAYLEQCESKRFQDFVPVMQKVLSLLYLKAAIVEKPVPLGDMDVPQTVTEADYNAIEKKVADLMGEYDSYFDGDEASSVSENLADIYQELKDFIMNYKKGDRLGHALVLGVNVNEYYRSRSFTICMTKQMLLDNVAWLYHKCRVLGGYKKTQRLLLEKFKEHIKYVYDQEPDIDTYYCAWLLRGDNPNMYKFDGDVKPLDLGEWNEASLNSSFNHLRKSKAVCKLYYLYQYDADVKLKGNKMTNFIIDEKGELLDAIIFIQTAMRKKVQNMGIAIECNPTSNFKIGEIERYDEHPICLFYDYRKDKRYSHISSSINTDDKGIFSTSIEREYALIYAAFKRKISLQRSLLCKEFDIVKWLDEIREHSNQQCFLK